MEIRDFVKKILSISPDLKIEDIKMTQELNEKTGRIEGCSWDQWEASGRWKVELMVTYTGDSVEREVL